MKTRVACRALGLAAFGVGVSILLTDPYIRDPLDVAWWLVGAVVLHDGVLVPLVLLLGALLLPRNRLRGPLRGPLRGGLITGACVTAIALPAILAPGNPTNTTLLPLDYVRNWLVALGAVACVTAAVYVIARIRSR